MKARKTLSNWLTGKYLLIIRNEENFAEKTSFNFSYAKLILILAGFFLISSTISFYIFNNWGLFSSSNTYSNKELLSLVLKIDSLKEQIDTKSNYMANIKKVVSGEEITIPLDTIVDTNNQIPSFQPISKLDSEFRSNYEKANLADINTLESQSLIPSNELNNIYLFSPLDGIITSKFNLKENHFGIDIVTKLNEPVRAVSDGTVLLATWTVEGGYIIAIQHINDLISVYKHNSKLFKKKGNFVVAGEVIATVGNTGELTTGPHLHMELWHKGNPVDPNNYIAL